MSVATAAPETEAFRTAFAKKAKALPPNEPAWVGERRHAGLARFEEAGFPTTHDEAWRFTSVAPLARTSWTEAPAGERSSVVREASPGDGAPRAQIVFMNGRFAPDLSTLQPGKGVTVASLRAMLDSEPQRLEPVLGRVLTDEASVFAALNTAFLDEGAVVAVAADTVVAEPVHVLFFTTNAAAGAITHPRVIVLAGRNSQLTLVETYEGAEGTTYLTNAVTEMALEDGAVVDHYRVQIESRRAYHVGTTAVRQGRASTFSSSAITLGAALSRHEVLQAFAGEGGDATLNGLFFVDGSQHADIHTLIDHATPHCASRELVKGVLGGRARGVFHGTIRVREGAQKTDAHQVNKNLLLTKDALVNSTPALEILADDVKCKHGSTTGQLDPAALFYLRSRGIAEAEARRLLVSAFASDVVSRIKLEPLRESLTQHLQAHLPAGGGSSEAGVA